VVPSVVGLDDGAFLTHDWSLCDRFPITAVSQSWPTRVSLRDDRFLVPAEMVPHLSSTSASSFCSFKARSAADVERVFVNPSLRLDLEGSILQNSENAFLFGRSVLKQIALVYYWDDADQAAKFYGLSEKTRVAATVTPVVTGTPVHPGTQDTYTYTMYHPTGKPLDCPWKSCYAGEVFDTVSKTCVDLCSAYWFRRYNQNSKQCEIGVGFASVMGATILTLVVAEFFLLWFDAKTWKNFYNLQRN
jgi:hypothetical protein